MAEGWIKLYRSIRDWEWYKDTHTKVLFIHLLLCSTKDNRYIYSQTLIRGQYITTVKRLSEELGISTKGIRTALNHLVKSGNIQLKTSNKYTLITIINYDLYQSTRQTNNIISGKQTVTQTANEKQEIKQGNNSNTAEERKGERQTKGKQTVTQTASGGASIKQEERNKKKEINYCSSASLPYTPTLEEIQIYINKNNYNINAEYFYNYYKSRGWKIGNILIRTKEQLSSIIDNWQIRETDKQQAQVQTQEKKNTFTDYKQKIYTEEEIKEIIKRKRQK